MTNEFQGKIGRTFEDSTAWWPPLTAPPDGAPNVLVVLLDDVGYAQFGCYGSDIATPGLITIKSACINTFELNGPVWIITCGMRLITSSTLGGFTRESAADNIAPWRSSQA